MFSFFCRVLLKMRQFCAAWSKAWNCCGLREMHATRRCEHEKASEHPPWPKKSRGWTEKELTKSLQICATGRRSTLVVDKKPSGKSQMICFSGS